MAWNQIGSIMEQFITLINDIAFNKRENENIFFSCSFFSKLPISSVVLSLILLTNVTGSLSLTHRHSLLVAAVPVAAEQTATMNLAAVFRLWRVRSSLFVDKFITRFTGPFQWDPGILVHGRQIFA